MAIKQIVLTHQVESGGARMRVELRIDEAELSLAITSSVELAFCLQILGRRHCLEAPQDQLTTLLRVQRGPPCTAQLEKPGHSVELPIAELLPVLRSMDLPLLWPAAEDAIRKFVSNCE